jgi:hypothetical protein
MNDIFNQINIDKYNLKNNHFIKNHIKALFESELSTETNKFIIYVSKSDDGLTFKEDEELENTLLDLFPSWESAEIRDYEYVKRTGKEKLLYVEESFIINDIKTLKLQEFLENDEKALPGQVTCTCLKNDIIEYLENITGNEKRIYEVNIFKRKTEVQKRLISNGKKGPYYNEGLEYLKNIKEDTVQLLIDMIFDELLIIC